MGAVAYTDIPDTQRQQIKDSVPSIKEFMCPTLNSFKKSTRTVVGGQRGYQVPFFPHYYTGNSYLTPDSGGNSFKQSVAPTSLSMWVGLSYQGKVIQIQGMLANDLSQKQSIINEARLRDLAMEEFLKTQNYYACGDRSGAVAYVTSITGGTFTGTTAAQTTAGYTKGAHRLRGDNVYDIIDPTSFTVIGTITPTIDGTNSATVPVVATGSPNVANAIVVEQGAYNKVPAGLAYLINNATRYFQGVNNTNFPEFRNSAIDLNGAAITSATVGTIKTRVQIRLNDPDTNLGAVGHIPPGLFHTLAIQGYGARQYQAAEGQATTSFGQPMLYEDGDTMWVKDADMDEDRVYLRRAGDYFMFESIPLGPVTVGGITKHQPPGLNNVGAWEEYDQQLWVYNLGFDGELSGGNDGSAYIQRAATTNTQVNSLSTT